MHICHVYNLIDLHLNKSLILLYSAPDMKRQQIMGGCGPPWEAREQIKRPAAQGTKAMFWCCVIKQRHRARGRGKLQDLYIYIIYIYPLASLFGFLSPSLSPLCLVHRNQAVPALFLFFDTHTFSSLWTVLSLAHGSCLSKAMAWAPGQKKGEWERGRSGL